MTAGCDPVAVRGEGQDVVGITPRDPPGDGRVGVHALFGGVAGVPAGTAWRIGSDRFSIDQYDRNA